MTRVPLVAGVLLGFVAFNVGGVEACLWLGVGMFFGGWVPLYLMPWLRQRSVRSGR